MPDLTLADLAALLAALAIAAPLARWLGVGSVLGYLVAGVLLGPYGAGLLVDGYETSRFLHVAEFGIVLLLFLIGLELRPKRLWSMRNAIFGLGSAQLLITASLLAVASIAFGLDVKTALFAGLALALSSTAFALQVLEERGEISTRHGRLAFGVLLFQDLAAIPIIALTPLFAVTVKKGFAMSPWDAASGLATMALVVVGGHFVLDRLIRLVALTKVREAMTAAALLTVVSVAMVMQWAGLSPALGAFIAGALLAESSYRHQLEADIQPFQGILLGLFFTAIGMSLDLELIVEHPTTVFSLVAGLVLVKTLVLFGLGISYGLPAPAARRLGLALSQGGEFAFVLATAGLAAGALTKAYASLIDVVVTLSMAATPLLLAADGFLARRRALLVPLYETPPEKDGHVVIAGFGRFGQVVARVLRAKGIPFTALDIDPEQVELVKSFGSQAFYGDASRLDILEAAQTGKARAFVLAIDDVEASMRTIQVVRRNYPDLAIFARARNRNHVHRLMDAGIKHIRRETYLSALDITRRLLVGLGSSERQADRAIELFRIHDERRLFEDYQHFTDLEKLQAKARSDAATLEKLFDEDADIESKLAAEEAEKDKGKRGR